MSQHSDSYASLNMQQNSGTDISDSGKIEE